MDSLYPYFVDLSPSSARRHKNQDSVHLNIEEKYIRNIWPAQFYVR